MDARGRSARWHVGLRSMVCARGTDASKAVVRLRDAVVPGMIVDFHCHFSRLFFRFREYRMNPEALLREMDHHGVSRAVVSAAGEFAAYFNTRGNDDIAVLAQRFPQQIIGFATINPWMRAKGVEE